jgi:hypothetical protein
MKTHILLISLFHIAAVTFTQASSAQPRRSNKVAPADFIPSRAALETCSPEAYNEIRLYLPKFDIPQIIDDRAIDDRVRCPLGNLHLLDGTIYTCEQRRIGGAFIYQDCGTAYDRVTPVERERLTPLLTDENILLYSRLRAVNKIIARITEFFKHYNHAKRTFAIRLNSGSKTYTIVRYQAKLYALENRTHSKSHSHKECTLATRLAIVLLSNWDGNNDSIAYPVSLKKHWWLCC